MGESIEGLEKLADGSEVAGAAKSLKALSEVMLGSLSAGIKSKAFDEI